MRSNAGMANRQGDVDLRFAKSPPPVNILAWLGLDCTDCVTIWMTLTVRCKVGQLWDIIWIIERGFCWVFDSRYVEVMTKILQQTKNFNTLSIYSSNCSLPWKIREKINDILGYLNLFCGFCWKRPVQNQRHQILLILIFHLRIWVRIDKLLTEKYIW